MASSTASRCETSCRLAPVTTSDNGTPRPSTSKWRLLPFFSPICRIGANALLCHWCLHHCTVNTLPSPGNAFKFIVLGQPGFPQCFKNSSLLPLQESSVDRSGAAITLKGLRSPLATRSQHIDDCLKDESRVFGFASTTSLSGVRLLRRSLTHWDQRLNSAPKIVRDFPCFCFCHLSSTRGHRVWRTIILYLRISSYSRRQSWPLMAARWLDVAQPVGEPVNLSYVFGPSRRNRVSISLRRT